MTSSLFPTTAILLGLVALVAGASSPLDYTRWKGQRVLFVAAHPDDIVGTTGGLVGALSDQGTNVSFVIVTNGDKGCSSVICQGWTSEQIAAARYNEALASAAVVGVSAEQVHLLDFEDGMEEVTSYPDVQIRRLLVQYIRQIRPHVVMTWYPYPDFQMAPSKGWDDLGFHPDHQAVGRLTLAAKFDAGVGLLFPESGAAWAPAKFYMWSFINPELFVSISQKQLDRQIDAYLQHKTQYPSKVFVEKFVTDIAEMVANTTGVPNVSYAEGFLPFY